MATSTRKVDVDVLLHLASETVNKERNLQDAYEQARHRIDSTPNRWDRSEWEGTRTFTRLEWDQMERERNELTDRAWKTAVWAAVSQLDDPLPLTAWKFLLGTGTIAGMSIRALPDLANVMVGNVQSFVRKFADLNGRTPTSAEIKAGVGSAGGVGSKPSSKLPGPAGAGAPPVDTPVKVHHINQESAEAGAFGKQPGFVAGNADCAPTSAVMALSSLGLRMPGQSGSMSDGELVALARRRMATDPARDGVVDDHYSDKEHSIGMTGKDIEHMAHDFPGLSVTSRTATPAAISSGLKKGSSFVVSGKFSSRDDDSPWPHNYWSKSATDLRHVISVTGYDEKTQKFEVHDPGLDRAIFISAEQLQKFMESNGGAWEFSKVPIQK